MDAVDAVVREKIDRWKNPSSQKENIRTQTSANTAHCGWQKLNHNNRPRNSRIRATLSPTILSVRTDSSTTAASLVTSIVYFARKFPRTSDFRTTQGFSATIMMIRNNGRNRIKYIEAKIRHRPTGLLRDKTLVRQMVKLLFLPYNPLRRTTPAMSEIQFDRFMAQVKSAVTLLIFQKEEPERIRWLRSYSSLFLLPAILIQYLWIYQERNCSRCKRYIK